MKQILVETIIRLASKSPKYFRALQIIIVIITALCGALKIVHDNELFNLPKWAMLFTGPESIVAGIAALILARLPVESAGQLKAQVDAKLDK